MWPMVLVAAAVVTYWLIVFVGFLVDERRVAWLAAKRAEERRARLLIAIEQAIQLGGTYGSAAAWEYLRDQLGVQLTDELNDELGEMGG